MRYYVVQSEGFDLVTWYFFIYIIIGAVYVARERKWFSLFVAIAVRTMVCVSWCAADALERGAHALRASGG